MLPLLTTASSSPGTPELLTLALDRFPDEAILDMIVDQPHRLHEGVHGSRSNEFPTLLFELLRQRDRLRRWNAARKFSCFKRIVRQLKPD